MAFILLCSLLLIDRIICLSLVCLYLSLSISFLLFGHLFFFCSEQKNEIKKNVQIIKRKYIMTNINTQETDYSDSTAAFPVTFHLLYTCE